jgi:hypothetical protein
MRRTRGLVIVGLLAASFGAAAIGVNASPAASNRASARSSTIDSTYSCGVRRQHYVDINAGVSFTPANSQHQPGFLVLTTVVKTIKKNGTVENISQVSLQSVKDSLRIDKSTCHRVTKQISLKPKGLPGGAETATPSFREYVNARCKTAVRKVLVRLQVTIKNGTPTHAKLAIRNENAKNKPVALYSWSARKISAYLGNCVDLN